MERTPAQVFCLAEYLYEEMVARGWNTDQVAIRMQTPAGAAMDLFCLDILLAVQDDGLIIDDEMFQGLGRAFEIDVQYLRNLHQVWLERPDSRSPFEVPDEIFGPTSRRAMLRVVC